MMLNILKEHILEGADIQGERQTIIAYSSSVEGLGNKFSDYDVYVIYDSEKFNEKKSLSNKYIHGINIDYEYWKLSTILEKIMQANTSSFMRQEDLKVLHRILKGAVLSNDELGNHLKDLVQKSNYIDIIRNGYVFGAIDGLDDGNKFFVLGEITSSYHCIRTALNYAIYALNAYKEHPHLKDKWAVKIFLDNNGYNETYLEKFNKHFLYPRITTNTMVDEIINIADFVQDILYEVGIIIT